MTPKRKIKILTDSGSDIPLDLAAKHALGMIPFPIISDGVTYLQGVDFTTAHAFYDIMKNAVDLPKTSQIIPMRYIQEYARIWEEGYRELVVITINAQASSTYSSALHAKALFYEEHPTAQSDFHIHVIDSKCYSIAYGYPALHACDMVRQGRSLKDILDYLAYWFAHLEIYVAAYSLDYAKRSGRVGTASAVLGEALGIKPIIRIVDGVATTYRKVRGNASVGQALYDIVRERILPDSPYGILHGTFPDVGETLRTKLVKATGREPFGLYDVGPAVALNIGPSMLGVGFLADRNK